MSAPTKDYVKKMLKVLQESTASIILTVAKSYPKSENSCLSWLKTYDESIESINANIDLLIDPMEFQKERENDDETD